MKKERNEPEENTILIPNADPIVQTDEQYRLDKIEAQLEQHWLGNYKGA